MDWRHRAICRDEDPELFFPIGNTGPALLQIEQAKMVCRRCPVIQECLTWALESGQDAGVWGGLSEDERRAPQAPQRPRSRPARLRSSGRLSLISRRAGRSAPLVNRPRPTGPLEADELHHPARPTPACSRSAGPAGPTRLAVNPSGSPTPVVAHSHRLEFAAATLARQRRRPCRSRRPGSRARWRSESVRSAPARAPSRPAREPRRSCRSRSVLTRSPEPMTSDSMPSSRSTISSNSTDSSMDDESVSCTRAIDWTRRIDSSSAVRASGTDDPAGLQPQQRGHGLQVVLHPVVDLADGRVLAHDLPIAAPQFGDVLHEQQRAQRLTARTQRQRAEQDDRSPTLDLDARRLAAVDRSPPRPRRGRWRRTGRRRRPRSARATGSPSTPPPTPSRLKADSAFGLA